MDNAEKLRPRVLCKCQHDENQHHSQAVRSIGLANDRYWFTSGCGRPVNGSHVASFTDRSWPISDRFVSPNPPFSETYPGPSASGKSRPQTDPRERRLHGILISVARF
jgi:hypothetical protein